MEDSRAEGVRDPDLTAWLLGLSSGWDKTNTELNVEIQTSNQEKQTQS